MMWFEDMIHSTTTLLFLGNFCWELTPKIWFAYQVALPGCLLFSLPPLMQSGDLFKDF